MNHTKTNIAHLLILLFSISTFQLQGQDHLFKKHISYLASEQLAGRLTGSEGEKLAGDYIAKAFSDAGLVSGGENGTWFQTFSFIKFRLASMSEPLDFYGITSLQPYKYFYPLTYSCDTANISSMPLQGVSYGFRDSGDFDFIDTLTGIAVVKAGLPTEVNPHSTEAMQADWPKRIRLLQQKGAKAIIICKPYTGFTDVPEKGLKVRGFQAQIPVIYADTTYAFITGYPEAAFHYVIHKIMGEGRNVVGVTPKKKKSTVIIGAHYDHIGRGELGGSRKDTFASHYGADDNASGTAMIMELAKAVKNKKLNKHRYVFVAFSGEELGLLGSHYFANNPSTPIPNTRAMLNFDMVGRMDTLTPKLYVGGTGTCMTWEKLLNEIEDTSKLFISKDPKGTGATDHTNFYYKQIPVLSFFTGLHNEYHTPNDIEALINYNGMTKVYDYVYEVLLKLNHKKYRKGVFQSVKEEKKEASSFKVTLGVMPDYGYSGQGLKISGANKGGPAELAGLIGGDVVTKIGTHDISDIYAYMKVLSLFKKGDTTTIVFLREGESKEAQVTF